MSRGGGEDWRGWRAEGAGRGRRRMEGEIEGRERKGVACMAKERRPWTRRRPRNI